jgi:hypothetical protein
MVRRNVAVGSLSYVISPEDPVPLGDRYWSVLRVRVIDELIGRPPRGDMKIETDYPGLVPRVVTDGLMGFVGRPTQVFPALNGQPYDVDFTLRVVGYLPRRELATIPIDATFPDTFAPLDVGDLPIHREPIEILGRTVAAAGITTTPLAGMTVSITGIWLTLPPGNVAPPPPDPPNLISLSVPLYLPRTTATGTLRQRELVTVPAQDKLLVENVRAGGILLQLSDGINLNPGDILAVDAPNADRVEYLTIQTIAPATTPTSVSNITLTHAMATEHRRDVVVRRVLPQAPGFSNPFSRNAQAGDTCVFLNSMTNLAAANVVEISGAAGDPVEYHSISRFTTTSDANGYFRLPLLSRVAQLDIQADDGGVHPTQSRTLVPNYEERENRVDFIF